MTSDPLIRRQHGLFLSSTNDPIVRAYRLAARAIIEDDEFSDRWYAIEMSEFPPSGKSSLAECERLVKQCSVYIGILGPFYGSVNEDNDLSYTEYEYQTAHASGREIGIFLLPDSVLNQSPAEVIVAQGHLFGRQQAFREKLNDSHLTRAVTDEDDFKVHFRRYLRELKLTTPAAESRETEAPTRLAKPFLGEAPLGTYDRRPVLHYTLRDLSRELVAELLGTQQAQLVLDQTGLLSASEDERLRLLGLLHENTHPLLGAVLCLAPQQLLADKFGACTLHMVVYSGPEKASSKTLYKEEATTNLVDLFRMGMRFFRTNAQLKRSGEIGSAQRDDLEIPTIALREALANALVHRDYEDAHFREQPTRLEVYSDRVEIISYGGLVRGVTETELNEHPEKVDPQRRNPVIASIFLRMGMVELGGSGVSRMHEAMREANLSAPRIIQSDDHQTVKVIFPRPQITALTPYPLATILASHPDDIPGRQRKIFGREQVLGEIRMLLNNGERVLLVAEDGMGKTAIAAEVAAQWVENEQGPVLWVTVGDAPSDISPEEALITAITTALDAPSTSNIPTQKKVIQQVSKGAARLPFREQNVRLIVLDDVRNSAGFEIVLEAMPSSVGILVTSPSRLPFLKTITLEELNVKDSLDLLSYYVGRPMASDNAVRDLIGYIGSSLSALRMAGAVMAVKSLNPADLLSQLQAATSIHETSNDRIEVKMFRRLTDFYNQIMQERSARREISQQVSNNDDTPQRKKR